MKIIVSIAILALSINAFAQIPTIGLVGYYPFTGNANDMSGNNYHGTLHGPVLTLDRFGNPDCAYNFDGVNDYIDLIAYTPYFDFPQPASVSFWVNTKYDVAQTIYSIGDGADQLYASCIYIGDNCTGTLTNELITVGVQTDATDKYIVGFTTTNRNALINTGWHHVVILFNDTSTEIYLDNNQLSVTCNWGVNNGHYGNLTIAATTLIGVRYANGYGGYLKGALDDLRIYNDVLTPAEITALYQETVTEMETKTINDKSISIYPNPANGKFNISCNFNFKSVEVLNVLGELIFKSGPDNFQKTGEIDLSGVPKGIYVAKINDGTQIYTKEIVLQ